MANYKNYCRDRECRPDHDYRPDDDCKHDDHKHDDRPKFPIPITILNCGTGTGVSLPVNNINGNGIIAPLVVGSVNLDTGHLKKSTKKIEFSSLINARTDEFENDFTLRIIFQLSAVCNGGCKVPLGTWSYEKHVELEQEGVGSLPEQVWSFQDPFSFVWCECEECPECCRFIVEVAQFQSESIVSASITNVGISALAVGLPDRW